MCARTSLLPGITVFYSALLRNRSSYFLLSPNLQSAFSAQAADQPDLGHLGHPAEPNSAEVPAAASATNGVHDASAAPGLDPLQHRENGSGPAPDHQFLNPGPSCRANRGSSSSIPYIDCSDIDSECDVTKGNTGHRNANDSNADETGSYNKSQEGSNRNGGPPGKLFAVVNGFYHTNHQWPMQQHQQQGGVGQQIQQTVLADKSGPNKMNGSHEFTDCEILPNGGSRHGRAPLHSTLLDEIFQGRDKRPLGTRSQCSSPVINSFHHRTNSFSHAEMTNSQPHTRWIDSGLYLSRRPGVGPAETPPHPNYANYSPITSNHTAPHFAKPYNNNHLRNRSDTDPFILSQLTSTPIHLKRTGPNGQAPGSAPMERRIISNGNHVGNLLVPGQARSNTVQRLYGRQGKSGNNSARNRHNLNQPVQMIDGSTSSGSDTSDTESDTGSSSLYSQPLMFGNPAAVSSMNSINSNGVHASPLLRSKLCFGSLQLEEGEGGEEGEERGCYRFNEEVIEGQVFRCWSVEMWDVRHRKN